MGATADQKMRSALGKSDLSESQKEALFQLFLYLNEYPSQRVGQTIVNARGQERNFACPEVYYVSDVGLAMSLHTLRHTSEQGAPDNPT